MIGVTCLGASGVLTLAGKTIAITHGDDARIMSRFQRAGHDYLLTGHTHLRHDRRMEGTRWINPGALYRAAVKSVALLDLSTDTLDFVTIPEA
jgi:predicted phosphodiesterase